MLLFCCSTGRRSIDFIVLLLLLFYCFCCPITSAILLLLLSYCPCCLVTFYRYIRHAVISEFFSAKYHSTRNIDNYCYYCNRRKTTPVDLPVKICGDPRLPVVLRPHEHQRPVVAPGRPVVKAAVGQKQRQQSHKFPHDTHDIGNSRFLAAHCERMQQYINRKSGHGCK